MVCYSYDTFIRINDILVGDYHRGDVLCTLVCDDYSDSFTGPNYYRGG